MDGWTDEFIPSMNKTRRISWKSKAEQNPLLKVDFCSVQSSFQGIELPGKLFQIHISLLIVNPFLKMSAEVL